MDRLCDEVIQLIFFELNDPTPLILVSKRFHHFAQDPYVRAHYFLTRYGHIQAVFWALGRGKLMNERVLDILLTSGAHLSRYLVQVAIHHYFRTTAHFVKSTWVRSVPFPVFTYFLKLAAERYGEIPCGKGDDDGSLFASFLKESKFPAAMKSINWEEIKDILEKYKFIPFSNKDPIMAQFPLALAIEPRVLPLATANGFHMDSKYRDFVFRKMFERPAVTNDGRTDEIMHNVRELCKLDSTMFLSRTVAAEICMEAKINEPAYTALKRLDKTGQLLFELSTLVEDLIKLFMKTRSVTTHHTIQVLRQLYTDFPSTDPTVRLVLLLTVFLSDNCLAHTTPVTLKSKLEPLALTPLTRKDIFNVLVNPFVERYAPILEYAKVEVGLNAKEVRELVEEVAVKCLEVGCKGKMLRKLFDGFSFLHDTISMVVIQRYYVSLDDLPQPEDEKACAAFQGKLCRDYIVPRAGHSGAEAGDEQEGANNDEGEEGEGEGEVDVDADMVEEEVEEGTEVQSEDAPELGHITQDTLTTMIRNDELAPTRTRRRPYYTYPGYGDAAGKLPYPSDPLQVGRWIKSQFGVRSNITAVFLTHAVINDNSQVIQQYLGYTENHQGVGTHVPITLKHFKLLARLGRQPNYYLYQDIEMGAEFYFDEEDYLTKQSVLDAKKGFHQKIKVKTESTQSGIAVSSPSSSGMSVRTDGSPRGRKRPRRTAATIVRSYAVPDSDDEALADEEVDSGGQAKKKKVESNLQRWIRQLSILLKDEHRKFKEKKKRLEKSAPSDTKIRVPKSEFFKSLASNLRSLRKVDLEKRLQLYGPEVADEAEYTDGDDDEYQRKTRVKKRKVARAT